MRIHSAMGCLLLASQAWAADVSQDPAFVLPNLPVPSTEQFEACVARHGPMAVPGDAIHVHCAHPYVDSWVAAWWLQSGYRVLAHGTLSRWGPAHCPATRSPGSAWLRFDDLYAGAPSYIAVRAPEEELEKRVGQSLLVTGTLDIPEPGQPCIAPTVLDEVEFMDSAPPPSVSPRRQKPAWSPLGMPVPTEAELLACETRLPPSFSPDDRRHVCLHPYAQYGMATIMYPEGSRVLMIGSLQAQSSMFASLHAECAQARPSGTQVQLSAETGFRSDAGAWHELGTSGGFIWIERPAGGWQGTLGGEATFRGRVSHLEAGGCRPPALLDVEIVQVRGRPPAEGG